mgnify:FL=1
MDVDALNNWPVSITVPHLELINESSKSATTSLYNKFETQVSNIFDKHIPEKTKVLTNQTMSMHEQKVTKSNIHV